ncbi:MAG: acetate/propionate family kinase [Steroidobacteraceae bacterium]
MALPTIAVLNGGSSSIKFALYSAASGLQRQFAGSVRLEPAGGATLTFTDTTTDPPETGTVSFPAAASVSECVAGWMAPRAAFSRVRTIGHRVVHGMQRSAPALVTPALLQELRLNQPFDIDHLPLEIQLMEAFTRHAPLVRQLACFDTAFHADMPRRAKLLPVPRHYEALGVRRYGFHGLSYAYLTGELRRLGDPAATSGRVILAHLGGGSSMAAVLAGRCIDTSMGFTPASGLMMGTRSGDVDPGLVGFLTRSGHMTAAEFDRMANRDSGLLGVSQLTADVQELLALESQDVRAAEALELFCYQSTKCIGAYVAALGGLDTLVFSGGIGEHAWQLRERICAGLQCLGIDIDPQRNRSNAPLISSDGSRVSVRVIPTDEELIIARACAQLPAAGEKE